MTRWPHWLTRPPARLSPTGPSSLAQSTDPPDSHCRPSGGVRRQKSKECVLLCPPRGEQGHACVDRCNSLQHDVIRTACSSFYSFHLSALTLRASNPFSRSSILASDLFSRTSALSSIPFSRLYKRQASNPFYCLHILTSNSFSQRYLYTGFKSLLLSLYTGFQSLFSSFFTSFLHQETR